VSSCEPVVSVSGGSKHDFTIVSMADICFYVSIWFAGHVTGQLDDEQWTVSTGSTDSLHSGLVSTLRLYRQDPLQASL